MKCDHKNLEFVIGDCEAKTAYQKAIIDIVFLVKDRLALALQDKKTGLVDIHPRIMISMVVTNILVGLLATCICNKNSVSQRLKMIQDSLDEISGMTMELWKALEAQEANEKVAH